MASYESKYLKITPTKVLAKQHKTNKPGYICDCELGSPEPGRVILVSKLHSRKCHVRRKLADSSYIVGGDSII
jgi:hypothetical protein